MQVGYGDIAVSDRPLVRWTLGFYDIVFFAVFGAAVLVGTFSGLWIAHEKTQKLEVRL